MATLRAHTLYLGELTMKVHHTCAEVANNEPVHQTNYKEHRKLAEQPSGNCLPR